MTRRRVIFILISVLLASTALLVRVVPKNVTFLYVLVLSVVSSVAFYFALELKDFKKLVPYVLILPLHVAVGMALSMFGFPNLSLRLRLIFTLLVSLMFYISFLVLNIIVVVRSRGKLIPLYRAAVTWSQILIVVVAIPFIASVFKLPVLPLFQIVLVTISAFFLILYFLWSIEPEFGEPSLDLALLGSFWVFMLATSILFLPFEAIFRGLFLSSVLLFAIGFAHNYLKHALTSKLILEYIIITIAFLFLGLLFIP